MESRDTPERYRCEILRNGLASFLAAGLAFYLASWVPQWLAVCIDAVAYPVSKWSAPFSTRLMLGPFFIFFILFFFGFVYRALELLPWIGRRGVEQPVELQHLHDE
jgi:ABC-type multidrug transport system fused ATPase/permease subunit